MGRALRWSYLFLRSWDEAGLKGIDGGHHVDHGAFCSAMSLGGAYFLDAW
ncbi:MAG: hypothetical protein IJ153_07660 [Clostridia bacterium]|nr:hypothetical protein [Clostridia bacterium]